MIVPFDINIAKEISSGIREGRILTVGEGNLPVRIFEWNHTGSHPIEGYIDGFSSIYSFRWTEDGYFFSTKDSHSKNLCLEVEECSKIEFDIETARLALLAKTGKIVTRSGKTVNITKVDPSDPLYPLYGEIIGILGELTWTVEGKYFADERKSEYDLFIDTIFDI